ncbi:MAG: hypothetical protein HFH86_03515 [Bacilli bacterium]|jgi:hypothetical protein|nr:hypothetical protein [Bacilli bacterium]
MTKVILMNKTEISVNEEKKGKQIAVKENNITSLKEFYQNNYKVLNQKVSSLPKETIVETPIINNPLEASGEPVIPIEPIVMDTPSIEMQKESIFNESTPIITAENTQNKEANENNLLNETIFTQNNQTTEDSGNSPVINLIPESSTIESAQPSDDEMDPELLEIKLRLDQAIIDLNNYKKKIKILELEVNQNLEKSKEVLKDTQAAAEIMSIQQERQKKISEEINNQ